nr:RNA-directed DNA polymerase, eukaryota [Tanacetum cinerariifolium]
AKELFTWMPCFLEFKESGYNSEDGSFLDHQQEIQAEPHIEKGASPKGANPDELLPTRADLNRKLYEINQMDLKDIAQKAKIRWAIEGDENSKFFHGVINKRRSHLAIRGVFASGDWFTDPSTVKEAF